MAGILTQIATGFAYFASGFTLRDVLSFGVRKIHMRRERGRDNKIVAYLVEEVESFPLGSPNAYGLSPPLYYRSSRQIADALNLASVDVLQRLERMEGQRVKRPGPKADDWTATENELHDDAHRHRTLPRLRV